jgi:hypothetical protein
MVQRKDKCYISYQENLVRINCVELYQPPQVEDLGKWQVATLQVSFPFQDPTAIFSPFEES